MPNENENENCDLEFDLLSALWGLILNLDDQIADQVTIMDDLHYNYKHCQELQEEVPISCDTFLDQAEAAVAKYDALKEERDDLAEQAREAQERAEKCVEHLEGSTSS